MKNYPKVFNVSSYQIQVSVYEVLVCILSSNAKPLTVKNLLLLSTGKGSMLFGTQAYYAVLHMHMLVHKPTFTAVLHPHNT